MELVRDLKSTPELNKRLKNLLRSVSNVLSTNKASLHKFKGVRQLYQNLENRISKMGEGRDETGFVDLVKVVSVLKLMLTRRKAGKCVAQQVNHVFNTFLGPQRIFKEVSQVKIKKN